MKKKKLQKIETIAAHAGLKPEENHGKPWENPGKLRKNLGKPRPNRAIWGPAFCPEALPQSRCKVSRK